MLRIRDLFLSTLNILIFFSIFYFIFKINYTFRIEELFGSQVFLTEIIAPNAKWEDGYQGLIQLISLKMISENLKEL